MARPIFAILNVILIGLSCQTGLARQSTAEISTRISQQQESSAQQSEVSPTARPDTAPQNAQQEDSNPSAQGNDGDNAQVSASANAMAAAAVAAYRSTPRRRRLGRQPRMFGDWFGPGIQIAVASETPGLTSGLFSSHRIPNVARIGKVAENNSALPYDRSFLNYNYFKNASGGISVGPNSQSGITNPSVGRWTIGRERTFNDGLSSIEARMVINDAEGFIYRPTEITNQGQQSFHPTIGNMAFVGKQVLYENESTVLAMGAALEVPTGGDTFLQSGTTVLEIQNQSVFLSPYIGLLKSPSDSPWYAHFFIQVETPLNGSNVSGIDPMTGGGVAFGKQTPQTVAFVDLGLGRWIYQDETASITGVAAFFEAHYNTSLNDSDPFSGTVSSGSFSSDYEFQSTDRHFDILDLTFGLHFEMSADTRLRIAGVFPVTRDRAHDGELGIQFTRFLR